jgi:hypothetical protein
MNSESSLMLSFLYSLRILGSSGFGGIALHDVFGIKSRAAADTATVMILRVTPMLVVYKRLHRALDLFLIDAKT